jgi:hypothetical protein
MPAPDVGLIEPLLVGMGAVVGTVPIHAAGMSAILLFFRREKGRGVAGTQYVKNVLVLSTVVVMALLSHLAQIAVWGLVFIACGEFAAFSTAFYHSAMNYTTLGYGDIVMSPPWRLLGPLEAAEGMLMFGVSIAVLVGIITQMAEMRLHIHAQ